MQLGERVVVGQTGVWLGNGGTAVDVSITGVVGDDAGLAFDGSQ